MILEVKSIRSAVKVSLDFNGVAKTKQGTELIKRLKSEGKLVYIISALNTMHQKFLEEKSGEIGIPPSRVFATGSNKAKIEKILELNINTHYDNNPDVVLKLKGIGKLVKYD